VDTSFNLLAAGNPILDHYAFLAPERRDRISLRFSLPARGAHHVPLDRLHRIREAVGSGPPVPGGGAFNAVRIYARLGGRAAFFGAVGTDGLPFQQELEECGIRDLLYRDTGSSSGCSLTLISPGEEPLILVAPGAARELPPSAAKKSPMPSAELQGEVSEPGLLYLEGFLLSNLPLLRSLLARATAAGIALVFDPGAVPLAKAHRQVIRSEVLPHCRYFFASHKEIEALQVAPRSLPERYGIRAVAEKRDSAGSILYTGRDIIELPALPADAQEGSGAGDLYAGAFLAAVHSGADLFTAGRAASAAGAYGTEVAGGRLGEEAIAKVAHIFHTIFDT